MNLSMSRSRRGTGKQVSSGKGSAQADYCDLVGMYQLTDADIAKHKNAMLMKEEQKVVRQESIMGLQDDKDDPDKHKRLAERIFHNHDVTNARGQHIAKKAR